MEHVLLGTAKSRLVLPAMDGPPKGPATLRESAMRQGVMGTKRRAGEEKPFDPVTATGVRLSVMLPSPSCPSTLRPHAQIDPSLFSARLWFSPPAIATIPTSPPTGTGAGLATTLLPKLSEPHFQTVPSLFRAKLWI